MFEIFVYLFCTHFCGHMLCKNKHECLCCRHISVYNNGILISLKNAKSGKKMRFKNRTYVGADSKQPLIMHVGIEVVIPFRTKNTLLYSSSTPFVLYWHTLPSLLFFSTS
jgi:hypothetical protein